jgi:hypothetical protein
MHWTKGIATGIASCAIALLLGAAALSAAGQSAPAKTTTQAASASNWWKNAVIYEIYPRSFQDSNGDGIAT